MRIVAMVAIAVVLAIKPIWAQGGRDTLFQELRSDGNSVAALQQRIALTTTKGTAESLMREIAIAARLNVTFDVAAGARSSEVAVSVEPQAVATLLLSIARQARLQVRVSASGQLVVLSAPPTRIAVDAQEASPRLPVTLPPVRAEASRLDRQHFTSSVDPSTLTIAGAQLRVSPVFVEPDVLRSVQTMPGVQARSDYAAGFNVRGGEADQTMVMMDGYPIYNPYHLGGVFSTFIDPAVAQVELYRGNLPVRYGGRLSGVLDVRSTEPTSSTLVGSAELSLVSTSATVGKALDDSSGAWMVAARRTYADVLLSLFQPGAFPYHFQDGQGHVTKTLGGVRLSATAYDGLDAAEPRSGSRTGARWGNALLGVTARRPFALGSDTIVLEQRVSFSQFDTRVDVKTLAFSAADRVADLRLGGTISYRRPRATTTVGYEASFSRLSYASNSPLNPFTDFLPFAAFSQRSVAMGVFGDELWQPASRLLLSAGGRLDAVSAGAGAAFSPRLALKYFVGANTAITAAAGRASQWMHSLGREEEPIQPLQFWVASDSLRPISSVSDASAGIEHWLSERTLVHVEGFHKLYRRLLMPNVYNDPATPGDEFSLADGTSYGIDVLLRRFDGGNVSGWVAYTYAMNARRRPDGSSFYPSQDRRHNANVVATWRTNRYILAARANIASGFPATPVLGQFVRDRYDPLTQRWSPDVSGSARQSILADFNSQRLPVYRRIDLSATRPTSIRGISVLPYLSVVNVLNLHNPAAYVYDYTVESSRMSIPNLPFAPTIGVSVVF